MQLPAKKPEMYMFLYFGNRTLIPEFTTDHILSHGDIFIIFLEQSN